MLQRRTARIWIERKSKLASAQFLFAAQFVLLNASALLLSRDPDQKIAQILGFGDTNYFYTDFYYLYESSRKLCFQFLK